jgi:hypothetical protein
VDLYLEWREHNGKPIGPRVDGPELPGVTFEPYVDDAVVRCVSEAQAYQVRAALQVRIREVEVELELHPDKTLSTESGRFSRRLDATIPSSTWKTSHARPQNCPSSMPLKHASEFGRLGGEEIDGAASLAAR